MLSIIINHNIFFMKIHLFIMYYSFHYPTNHGCREEEGGGDREEEEVVVRKRRKRRKRKRRQLVKGDGRKNLPEKSAKSGSGQSKKSRVASMNHILNNKWFQSIYCVRPLFQMIIRYAETASVNSSCKILSRKTFLA